MLGKIGNVAVKVKNQIHHKRIMKKLYPYFSEAMEMSQTDASISLKSSNIIWVFWWQGEDKLTELSKKCLQSIKLNSENRKVILITKDNVKQYITLPSFIYEKVKNKEITLTHLSDIIRVNLLKRWGGLWLDSTIYVTNTLDNVPNNRIFTPGFYPNFDKENAYISKCQWSGFCIGGPANSELFKFLSNFFNIYWKNHDTLIDYYLLDYALRFAWTNDIGNFKNDILKDTNTEPNLYKLAEVLNSKYDKDIWNQITKKNNIFKLSNKVKINKDGTFYSHL